MNIEKHSLYLVAMNTPAPAEIVVTKDEFILGKQAGQCDGVIAFNPMISRIHCKVCRCGHQYTVTDLGSTNGTYVNRVRVQPNQYLPISHGDVLRLADSDFQILEKDYQKELRKETAIVVFSFDRNHVVKHLEIPLYISAKELVEALNKAYGLQNTCLKVENPSVFLRGNKTLAEYGIRNDSRIDEITGKLRDVKQQISYSEYPEFIRNNRVQYCVPKGEIEIRQPLPKTQKPKKNLMLSLGPSVAMLILMIVMRGMFGSGGSFVIYSLCSMGIGIIMSVAAYFHDDKEYRKAVKKREADYMKYMLDKEREIAKARSNELRIRNLISPALSDCIREVLDGGKRIYEKSTKDKDFLDIYLGEGSIEAAIPIKYAKQDFLDAEDRISMIPEELAERYRNLEHAPIVSKFRTSGIIGIVGKRFVLYGMLKNMTLDLVIRHFYNEVKIYYILAQEDYHALKWVRWLRHVHNDEVNAWNLICDEESRNILLEKLYTILLKRDCIKTEKEPFIYDVYYVVFVLDSYTIRQHPIMKYMEEGSQYGFTFVFLEEYEDFLPKGCTEVIRLDDGQHGGILINSENGDEESRFAYEPVSDIIAETVALTLGSITVNEVCPENTLTKNISLYELLNIQSADHIALQKRWSASQVFQSMAAPIGVKIKNEVVCLDISDKSNAHGPHGLVAGTTGSGKSEILQTYILSMSTLYHPHEVGFVIIDFKGGGMANQFKNLPHMLGAVTNIDGREIHRFLLSVKSELIKRQTLFAEANVNHINDYIKLFRNNEVSYPLPHLIIIVDEFAELKAEFPDFMKELISAARIGRTLGVHLILATQKPAGVVDSQIWSNSKFKLCLKVQTKEDSYEVLKTPLAADIVEPGRAYFQVGNNEIFEFFQSAYSGAKVAGDEDDNTKIFSIYELNHWGKRSQVFTNKAKAEGNNEKTQLQAVVGYVAEYCKSNGIQKLEGICQPPLPDTLGKEALTTYDPGYYWNIAAPIGIYDDPERQQQGMYCVTLSESNTYIIGAAMSGKTTMLQTILLQLMTYYSPLQVQVYIIDCGNGTLKPFEASQMVGGVVLPAEEDKVFNLFKLLFKTMEARKTVFSEKGLGTHRAYVEAGYTDMPQLILLIDNIATFKEYCENLTDDFLTLSREGNSLGISVVATAAQTNEMHYRAFSSYGIRIALVCNDTNEYRSLFDRCYIEPKNVAGRGLCMLDKRILEFQTVRCVDGEKEFERVKNIQTYIKEVNDRFGDAAAMPIPLVPERIIQRDIDRNLYATPYVFPIGMDFASVQYVFLDTRSVGYFGIIGGNDGGRLNFVRGILKSLVQTVRSNPVNIFVLDDENRSLNDCSESEYVQRYETDECMAQEVIEMLYQKMTERITSVRDHRNIQEEQLVLLVIESRKCIDYISNKEELLRKCKDILEYASRTNMCVIFSNVENVQVGFNAPDLYKVIKKNKKMFVFENVSEVQFVDLSMRQQRENEKPLGKEDALMCFGSRVERIRTIVSEEI